MDSSRTIIIDVTLEDCIPEAITYHYRPFSRIRTQTLGGGPLDHSRPFGPIRTKTQAWSTVQPGPLARTRF